MSQVTQAERSFTIVRQLDAPRELVFQAWTHPEHLHWFFETEASKLAVPEPAKVDLRVGGTWRGTMIQSADTIYATGGVYLEITPPGKLAFRWGAVDGWPPLDPAKPDEGPIVTVVLNDMNGTTEMTLEVSFPEHLTAESIRAWLSTGMVNGWNETLDRLGPYLASVTRTQRRR